MKLAILIYGQETDEEKIKMKAVKEKLQHQLNQLNSDDIDIVFHTDYGELGSAGQKAWLLEQTVAKKYVFVTSDTVIENNFLMLRFNSIKYGKSTADLIKLGIFSK